MAKAVLTSKKPINTVKIEEIYRNATIRGILPFRVRFTAIGISGFSPSNPPPIPIQVIGYSNYIL